MATLNIRNLPDEVHRELRQRAARHNRSMEAEARAILRSALDRPARAETLTSIMRELFGPEHGVELEPPDFKGC